MVAAGGGANDMVAAGGVANDMVAAGVRLMIW